MTTGVRGRVLSAWRAIQFWCSINFNGSIIASVEEIAAMKLKEKSSRGQVAAVDFIDLNL